jgi:aspartate/glutamate racemase
MKRIGILGGMSPESTTLYYEHITRNYSEQYGDYGYHCCTPRRRWSSRFNRRNENHA